MNPRPGKLLIVSGPSGVGKGTLLRHVMEQSPLPLVLSVSATTRLPRQGERDGVDYFFLAEEDFHRRRREGEFLECFEVYAGGNWYGTLVSHVEENLRAGKWVVLEIDVRGAEAVKILRPEAVTIFIEPKSPDVLRERLSGRGSEDAESLRKRLDRAEAELACADHYDYRVINDDIDEAARHFNEILDTLASPPHNQPAH